MRKLLPLILLVAAGAACAPKPMPAPVVTSPRFPDFTRPAVPPALANTQAAVNQDRGWRFLQVGDLRTAEREFQTALTLVPDFYPAENGLGYVELARKDAKAALGHFDRALQRDRLDLSALMGKGQALLALDRGSEALPVLEAALRVDPSLTEVAARVEVLKFREQQQELGRARQAAAAGRLDEAIAGYTRAIERSPESAFLYRELASVERQEHDDERALQHYRQALALEPGDARTLKQVGDLLEARGDIDGAIQAYSEALAAGPDEAVEAKLERLRTRAELARLPEEYRAIPAAPQVTRGDLAALVAVRLPGLVQSGRRRDAVLVTDIRNHWAAAWILAVAQAGIMEPYANHAFQPKSPVRRVDLAQVVNRLLARVAEATPERPHPWQDARLKFVDLAAGHLAYAAASAAVASGVIEPGPNNSFQPTRIVTGAEAARAVDRIAAMVPGGSGRGTSGR